MMMTRALMMSRLRHRMILSWSWTHSSVLRVVYNQDPPRGRPQSWSSPAEAPATPPFPPSQRWDSAPQRPREHLKHVTIMWRKSQQTDILPSWSHNWRHLSVIGVPWDFQRMSRGSWRNWSVIRASILDPLLSPARSISRTLTRVEVRNHWLGKFFDGKSRDNICKLNYCPPEKWRLRNSWLL